MFWCGGSAIVCSLCCRLAFSVFAILLLCLADPVWYSDRLVGNFVSLVCGLWQFFFASVISCDVCSVLICTSSLLLLVHREGYASWLWHFLGMFTYFCVVFLEYVHLYFCEAFLGYVHLHFVWHFLGMFIYIFVWHFLGMSTYFCVTYIFVWHFLGMFTYFCVAFPGYGHLFVCSLTFLFGISWVCSLISLCGTSWVYSLTCLCDISWVCSHSLVAFSGYVHLYFCVAFPEFV